MGEAGAEVVIAILLIGILVAVIYLIYPAGHAVVVKKRIPFKTLLRPLHNAFLFVEM
jgi:hypothetical protein